MRPVEPTATGTTHRAGADLAYEVYERDAPTVLLTPTWELIDSRMWKAQIPYLSRHFRVVVYDAAGTRRSSRPTDPGGYSQMNRLSDAVAVLDATGTSSAAAVGFSAGGTLGLLLAAFHPDRTDAVVSLAGGHPRNPAPDGRREPPWDPDALTPDALVESVLDLLETPANFADVETDGAAKAAALIGALL